MQARARFAKGVEGPEVLEGQLEAHPRCRQQRSWWKEASRLKVFMLQLCVVTTFICLGNLPHVKMHVCT